MKLSVMDMVKEAKSQVADISVQEAQRIMDNDDVLIIDVRDYNEVAASGKVKGALHISRGMLEFRADSAMPMYETAFSESKTILLYCASGGRSALAGQTLLRMGYPQVRNLGGFAGWVEAGGAIEHI